MQDLESTVEPTWPKLVEPLERIHDRLMVVWGAVNYLSYVNGSSELQAAVDEMEVHVQSLNFVMSVYFVIISE